MKRWITLVFYLFADVCSSNGQEIVNNLRFFCFERFEKQLAPFDEFSKDMLLWQARFLQEFQIYKLDFPFVEPSEDVDLLGRFYYYINKGDKEYHGNFDKNLEAWDSYRKAIDLALAYKNSVFTCEAVKKILELNRGGYLLDNSTMDYYLSLYRENAYDYYEYFHYKFYLLLFQYQNDPRKGNWDEVVASELISFADTSKHIILNTKILNLISNYEFNVMKCYSRARQLDGQAMQQIPEVVKQIGWGSTELKKTIIGNVRHIIYRQDSSLDFPRAVQFIEMYDTTSRSKVEIHYLKYYYFYRSILDTASQRFESAYSNYRRYNFFADQEEYYQNQDRLRELDLQYQSQKRQNEIMEQATVISSQQKFLWIISVLLIALICLSVALFLTLKSIRHKNGKIETLMRELHHRVKNNLQIISSLLGLQSMKLEDESAIKAVNEGKGRIRAMSLIHQKLYQTDEVTCLDIREYLTSLTAELVSAYGFQDRINLDIIAPSKSFDADRMLPIGLVINELVSNTFKYAFKDVDKPQLIIELRLLQENYLLIIEDNGPGLPKGFDLEKAESFGLKLVNILVEQMKGTLDYSKEEKSSRFQIQFDLGIHN